MKLETKKELKGTNCKDCNLDQNRVCILECPRNFPFSVSVVPGVLVTVSLSEVTIHPNNFNPVCLG